MAIGSTFSAIEATFGNPVFRNEPPPLHRAAEFTPAAPRTLAETGLAPTDVEALVLKFLWNRGAANGRDIADQIKIPFGIIGDVLRQMKTEQLVVYKSALQLNDYQYEATAAGTDRAQRYASRSTYFGAAPVTLEEYAASVQAQSVLKQKPRPADLDAALAGLILSPTTINQLGQAARAGRAMFLYGMPGNGKTSIAERICGAFEKYIWIPRALNIDGEIVRIYDPTLHREAPGSQSSQEQRLIDPRWIRIQRPTVVAGGELTLDKLELTRVDGTGIMEAPLQLKSNCGTLVIDDFGRQRVSPAELLNRWIVPLERHFDFLNSPSGKKVQVPFDQLVVFSTNLDPKDLVDEAFLRRIPYKVHVGDPTETDFRKLLTISAKQFGMVCREEAIDRLIHTHYQSTGRPFRSCHARDLLQQVAIFCDYHQLPCELTTESIDAAVSNYFGAL